MTVGGYHPCIDFNFIILTRFSNHTLIATVFTMGRPWSTAYPVLTLISAILALLVYYVVSSSAPCAQLLANAMQTSLAPSSEGGRPTAVKDGE